eukprot:2320905-Rhodomonas_salina.1
MKYGDLEEKDVGGEERSKRTFMEWLIFSYLNPLLELGSTRPLIFEDMPKLERENTAAGTGSALAAAWDEQLSREKPSLLMSLWKVQGSEYLWGNAWKVPHVCNLLPCDIQMATGTESFLHAQDALVFVAPVLLQEIIGFIDPSSTSDEELRPWLGIALVCLLFFSQWTQSLCLQHYFDKVYHCGMQ